MTNTSAAPKTQTEWRAALSMLPNTPDRIPAFFFAHGSPMLAYSDTATTYNARNCPASIMQVHGPRGTLASFLHDFGHVLIQKYQPRGIVVFSSHWDTTSERLVTDYGDENPLLYDYYGYDREYYNLVFRSRGNSGLSNRIVQLLREAGQRARTTTDSEARGRDGRGYMGPGLDQGVFLPFRHMFGETFMNVPIAQVSLHGSLAPDKNWTLGHAIQQLRREGILILAGGMTINNTLELSSLIDEDAELIHKVFDRAVLEAVTIPHAAERTHAMTALVNHPGFRPSHSHAGSLMPLFVAAGAGDDGNVRILNASYGIHAYAFGV